MISRITKIIKYGFSTKKFHQILGVSINATTQQIKSAYYQKAKQHHPDLNPNQSGLSFNQIRNAYDQLIKKSNNRTQKQSSENTKNQYKQYQRQFYQWTSKQNTKTYQNNNYNKNRRNNQDYFQQQQEQLNLNREQLKEFQKAFNSFLRNGYLKNKYKKFRPYFDQIFSSAGFSQNNSFQFDDGFQYDQQFYQEDQGNDSYVKNKHRLRKLDILYTLNLTKDQIGENIKIKFQREINCPKCYSFDSMQYDNRSICKSCHRGYLKNGEKCSNCKGTGFKLKRQCKSCRNRGYFRKTVQQIISVPLGLKGIQKLVIPGRGDQHRRKGIYGDLVVSIKIVKPKHKNRDKFQQQYQSSEKIRQVDVNIFEAVLGCIMKVKSNQGVSKIKVPAGAQHGDIIRNDDPKKDPKKIKISLTIPTQISKQQKIIYQKLRVLKFQKCEV